MVLLKLQNISYQSENKSILKNISLKIDAGDYLSIVGPSGSGKSTFLKLCAHLLSPTEGKIIFKGKDFRQYSPIDLRRKIGYCAQTPCLFGDTVEDNLSFPYLIRKEKVNLTRVQTLCSDFNLDFALLKKDVQSLSGGEKQRIALLRTLLFLPEIFLLDEVTSALDVTNTLLVEKVISSLNQKGTTVLWVTHNLEQSRKYANKLLTIENGEIKAEEVLK
ncbi:MAG: ATP-binding cassette domain-containing protein [Clostridia bacterium]|jgi:putative ABC transport system ATP-binding protein|nr:ATP-binding cassette domain-containing protein [Clostridia bacterium]MDD4145672.1 ATP-binding cassette domain-containing protein [Clostridia bacterium]MDD4665158.1 ATP-binding cassette domain-containing protein [Clostridia bacterium]